MTTFLSFQALMLCGLLYLIARHEADCDYQKVMLTTAGIMAGNFLLGVLLFPKISFFVFPVIFLFTWWMIVKFCWIPWHKGLLVTFLFFVVTVAYQLGKARLLTGAFALTSPYGNGAPAADTSPQSDYERTMKEGEKALADLREGTAKMELQASPSNAVTPPKLPPSDDPVAVETKLEKKPAMADALAPVQVPPPPLAPQVVAGIAVDWANAKSQLRIRGWTEDKKNGRTAMLKDEFVAVNGIATVDSNGLRYRWRLAALDGYVPRWEPVDVAAVPPEK